MSRQKITIININKFVSTFDETSNKIEGTPFLDDLFKDLKNANDAEAVAKETKEAKADHNIEEEEKKT